MGLIGRVDLLKVLRQAPEEIKAEMGDMFGFGFETRIKNYTMALSGAFSIGTESQQRNEKTQSEFNPPFWYLEQFQSRNAASEEEKPSQPTRTEERESQPVSPPLFSPAQQQVVWDRCLKHRLLYFGVDIAAAVKTIAQAKPIAALPKKKHEINNQETVLFLDRSHHLTPIWDDQMDFAESLQKLLGSEQCKVLLMVNGLSGPIRGLWRSRADDWTWDQLPDAARLLFVTDLAAYGMQNSERQAWCNRLNRLKNLGHPLAVLTPVSRPDNRFSFEQVSLDGKASQFNKLQVLLCGCLQAELSRIRQFRQHLAGGCLEDELKLWNHPERSQQPTGLAWRIDPQYLYRWKKTVQLSDDELRRYRTLQRSWRASMPKETEGLEQLIDEALDPDNNNADAALLYAALEDYRQNPAENTGVYRWLLSQTELLRALAQHAAGKAKWGRLYRYHQAARGQTEMISVDAAAPTIAQHSLHIQQIGADLHCLSRASRPLISTRDFIFDFNQGDYLEKDTKLSGDSFLLRTIEADIGLRSMTKPSWAERFWLDKDGIYAAHCENALFYLKPASDENPSAQWHCLHNPWTWASDAGIDENGLWAELKIKDSVQRLRWIPPGSFMMGSPEKEKDRSHDEKLHRVSLTQGFWLGETSCTQAFWQAVMGNNNPSILKDDPQLPVETISWHECQEFLSRLIGFQPDFNAELPTEAQWEYACRAGTTSAYWWGEEFDEHYANIGPGIKAERSYPGNAFGLKSMSGNVWEWCSDWYGEYPDNEVADPHGPQQGRERVLRGGRWGLFGRRLRSAGRDAVEPVYRNDDVGFRLAGGLDPQAGAQPFTAGRGPWNGQAGGGVRPSKEDRQQTDNA